MEISRVSLVVEFGSSGSGEEFRIVYDEDLLRLMGETEGVIGGVRIALDAIENLETVPMVGEYKPGITEDVLCRINRKE